MITLEATTGKDGKTVGLVTAAFLVNGQWVERVFFEYGAQPGETKRRDFVVTGMPTKLRLTIKSTDAWSFDKIGVTYDQNPTVIVWESTSGQAYIDGDNNYGWPTSRMYDLSLSTTTTVTTTSTVTTTTTMTSTTMTSTTTTTTATATTAMTTRTSTSTPTSTSTSTSTSDTTAGDAASAIPPPYSDAEKCHNSGTVDVGLWKQTGKFKCTCTEQGVAGERCQCITGSLNFQPGDACGDCELGWFGKQCQHSNEASLIHFNVVHDCSWRCVITSSSSLTHAHPPM